ncbi:MAG: hypothetical protein ABIL58_00945 [Pseudomonadota bacterium]
MSTDERYGAEDRRVLIVGGGHRHHGRKMLALMEAAQGLINRRGIGAVLPFICDDMRPAPPILRAPARRTAFRKACVLRKKAQPGKKPKRKATAISRRCNRRKK